MSDPHTVVPITMKGLCIVVCSTVNVLFIHIPEGYSKIPVDVGVVDIIEEISIEGRIYIALYRLSSLRNNFKKCDILKGL